MRGFLRTRKPSDFCGLHQITVILLRHSKPSKPPNTKLAATFRGLLESGTKLGDTLGLDSSLGEFMKKLLLAALLLSACNTEVPKDTEPGVVVEPSTEVPADYNEVKALIEVSENWSVDEFLGTYTPAFETSLGYNPEDAMFLDLIDNSSLALSQDEKARLAADGFVRTQQQFPTFTYGYATIYLEDLPIFVSADSILHAVHRSYDAILKGIELTELIPAMTDLIDAMRARLADGGAEGFTPEQITDLDLYLAVAGTLLDTTPRPAIAGASQTLVDEMVAKALAAEGAEEITIFGSKRLMDWSQFEPRGHYTDNPNLERYFRAMMWLSRLDFRMLEPNEQNQLEFRRRQFYNVIAMANLMDTQSSAQHQLIEDTVGLFVGEPDALILSEVPALLTALGAASPSDVTNMTDEEIATVIQKHRFGAQRISSHFMINGIEGTTKPLSHAFTLMSQRYVVDSHVFSNVVFDRVASGQVKRMMPNPLDVAFSVFGNDQAAQLLDSELREYGYQHDLNAMRVLVDLHDEDYWNANLYNGWLDAIRALSPTATPNAAAPAVAQTEAWSRRLLTAQMASWAELRHDTLLYTKQSYTNGAACEYPDVYVEPNPLFFEKVRSFAQKGKVAVAGFDDRYTTYFDKLEYAADRLHAMAVAQETGMPHAEEDVAWINQAVVLEYGCTEDPEWATGWYPQLFFDEDSVEFDPTIADVHTQPTDAAGNTVGRVLHVGTGNAHAMVVTVETCEGPRAYVGLGSSYFEKITENFERLTDAEWAPQISSRTPAEPNWVP